MNEIIKDDEIDLREVFGVLKKRKVFIILLVAVCAALAALFTLMIPATYTATSATLTVMQEPAPHERLMTSYEVMNKIREKAGDEAVANSKFKSETDRQRETLIFAVTSPDPAVSVELSRLWAGIYSEAYLSMKREEIESIKNRIRRMKKELENYPKYRSLREIQLEDLQYDRGGAREYASVVLEVHPFYQAFESEIAREKVNLSYMRMETDSFAMHVHEPAVLSQAKENPRPLARNILLAVVLSLFAAAVLIFIYEFLKGAVSRNK